MTEPQGVRRVAEPPELTEIGQAVLLHRAGDREEARNRLTRLWEAAGSGAGPLYRCTLAHFLAATQDDPVAALRWDLLALAEADAAAASPGAGARAARALYPALYLRLALDHAGLGQPAAARHELGRARRTAAGLAADDDYGPGLHAAIGRLAGRLAED